MAEPGTIAAQIVAPYVQVTSSWVGTGAGTVLQVDGELLVLTAAHVVEGYDQADEEKYKDAKGKEVKGKADSQRVPILSKRAGEAEKTWEAPVVWYSGGEEEGGHDLALLKPKDAAGLVPARIQSQDDLQLGESVWYIGTPRGMHARLEQSIVAVLDYHVLNHSWYLTNGCGGPGSSGGGLYVRRDGGYRLAGVITRKHSVDDGAMLAKKPTDIQRFLANYRKHKGHE